MYGNSKYLRIVKMGVQKLLLSRKHHVIENEVKEDMV